MNTSPFVWIIYITYIFVVGMIMFVTIRCFETNKSFREKIIEANETSINYNTL